MKKKRQDKTTKINIPLKKILTEKNEYYLILFLLVAVSALFSSFLFDDPGTLGEGDWVYHQQLMGVSRESIVEYNQLPFWNPYKCGGTILLAHPESMVFSPFFLFILLFGHILGFKILMSLNILIGMFGMFLLAKKFGINNRFSFLSSILFMLPVFMLRNVMGNYITLSLLPWIFLCFLKSLKKPRFSIICALLISVVWLNGNVYLLWLSVIFLVIYAILRTIFRKNCKPIKNLAVILIFILLISSIKFLPFFNVILDNPREYSVAFKKGMHINILEESLTKKVVGIYEKRPHQYGWWEYGYYIGIVPVILFLISIILFRKEKELLFTSIITLIISLSGNWGINIWRLLEYVPLLNNLNMPARFMMLVLLCVSLMIGIFLTRIQNLALNKFPKKKVIINIIIFILITAIVVDITHYNMFIFRHASQKGFKPSTEHRSEVFFQHYPEIDLNDREQDYIAFIENRGNPLCYESIRLKSHQKTNHLYHLIGAVKYYGETNYNGEVYLKTKGVQNFSWSPNRIIVWVNTSINSTPRNDTLIINQNHHKGWQSKDCEILNYDNLIGCRVGPENSMVTIEYKAPGFTLGAIISIISLIGAIILLAQKKKSKEETIEGKKKKKKLNKTS